MATQSTEIYRGQRGKEKRRLFAHFQFRVIQDVYRARFFKLFNDKCFKCGRPEKPVPEFDKPPVLCIDHHVPMALGGHLVPGNLVALCRECNHRKLDRPPEAFYTVEELNRLQPFLDAQPKLFDFRFDGERWMTDRARYLLDIGVPDHIVEAVTNDPDHPHFVGKPKLDSTTTLRLNVEFLAKALTDSAMAQTGEARARETEVQLQRDANA